MAEPDKVEDASEYGENVPPSERHVNETKEEKSLDTISSVSEITAPQVEVIEGFDPSIHAVDSSGEPKKKPNGEYALKRGRKPKGSSAVATALPQKAASTTVSAGLTDSPQISSDEAARQFCNLGINAAVMLLGDEWAPSDKAEAAGLKDAVKNYFDAAGTPELPAWAGLALALGAYSLPRIAQPTTRERLSVLWGRVKSWGAALRGKI